MLPSSNPIINSLGVCASITKREEATNPFINSKKGIIYMFPVWKCVFNPKTKTVKAEIASICKLALILINNNPSANKVLNKAPKKKKCNSR